MQVAPDERAFLGEEFLTWLWWRSETGRAEFELSQSERVGVALDAPLLLKSTEEDENGNRPEQTLKFGSPLRGPESGVALRRGKRLVRAKLILSDGTREWNCTFDAENFVLKSIRVPEPDADDDSGDPALENVSAFEETFLMFDAIFRIYLIERISPEFRSKQLREMRAWVNERMAKNPAG